MAPRIRRVTNVIFFLAIVLLTCAIYFRKPSLSRSASWEPMASLIVRPRRTETKESIVPRSRNISMIIHQTWKTGDIPELFKPWIRSWLDKNPDWEYWFWTDDDIRDFMAAKYPDYLELFESYPAPGYKADAFRYFALFEYGGVYADLDMEALRGLSDYVTNLPYACFLSQEPLEHAHFLSPMGIPLVSNALMGCSPGHPFFAGVIRNLPSRAGLVQWTDVLRATGPYMLTSIYRGYTSSSLFSHLDDDSSVHLADPDDFQPTIDDSMVDTMRKMCQSPEGGYWIFSDSMKTHKQLCPAIYGHTFNGKPKEYSYTNHHWTHTWSGRRYDPWGVFNNVRQTWSLKDELLKYKAFS